MNKAAQGLMTGLALGMVIATTAQAKERVTFTKDILPILQEHCIRCHRHGGDNISGMVAPMSLMTYKEVRPWSKAIQKAVTAKTMPPWFASEAQHGIFNNERRLADNDIATIQSWVASGAARGNPADAPEPLEFPSTNGWLTGDPDLIVTMPEPYLVEDDVDDLYVNFETEPLTAEQLPTDRWLRAIEWRGDSEVVHHIVGYASLTNEDGTLERFELGSIAPGEEGTLYPEGYGKLLKAGSKIHFNMHYHKEAGPGTEVSDQSLVGFRFWDEENDPPIQHQVMRNGIMNRFFEIPPGHDSWEVGASKTFDVETKIMSLHPHMHLRGKDARYEIIYPDGRRETMLDVPRFDFNWQLDYVYHEPLIVPAGTRVEFTVHYDNSAENDYNPDPTIPMKWGGPTTMEMMIGYISYANAEPMEAGFIPQSDGRVAEDEDTTD